MGKQPPPLNDDPGDWEFPSGRELGILLRTKREEMGLSHALVSDQIKVKIDYLEALENEDWDALPSPAFVKGFIRSYARFLGLSEVGLIALYQESAPPSGPLPRPIQAPPIKSRLPLYLVLVFALLVAGIAGYHWMIPLYMEFQPREQEAELPGKHKEDMRPASREERPDAEETRGGDTQQPSVPLDTAPVPTGDVPTKVPASVSGESEPDRVASDGEEAIAHPETEKETEVAIPLQDGGQPPISDGPPLILKAAVSERTWVRLTIDDQKPKEYIFDANSTPVWRAHQGFELVIGNAGGIALEFNGQKMEKLGKPGQVIKLRLPREEERSVSNE
jgi:cytoskeleton protein RodZ